MKVRRQPEVLLPPLSLPPLLLLLPLRCPLAMS
jgi:hypothetical protein